jgi:hypothetical protein
VSPAYLTRQVAMSEEWLRCVSSLSQAADMSGMSDRKRLRGQAPDGTRRGLSNPYRRQIPSFAYGSIGEKLRSIADLAAPEVAGDSLTWRTYDVS